MTSETTQMEELRRFLFWNQKIRLADVQRILRLGKTRANDYFIKLKGGLGTSLRKAGHDYVIDATTLENHPDFQFDADKLLGEFQLHPQSASAFSITDLSVDPLLNQHVDTEILRSVLHALRDKKGLEIEYVSAAPGTVATRRIIDPLGLFFINNRWHIHAYCRHRHDSRDFVLSRILNIHATHERPHPGLAPSIQKMLSPVKITITMHPDLSEDQTLAIRKMYRFDCTTKTLSMPRYKLYYFKKLYLCEENEGPPEKLLVEKHQPSKR